MKAAISNGIIVILSLLLIFGTGILKEKYVETKKLQTSSELRKQTSQNEPLKKGEKVEITVWSCYGNWDEAIEKFEKQYPYIKIKLRIIPYDECKEQYMDALNEGQGPDIFVMDGAIFSNFNCMSGFEDLLDTPYYAGRYREYIPETLWNLGRSFDKKKLLGIPCETTSLVTYYRADIMEQYGFPYEPEEMAKFMENPDNWVEIAQTLKKDDKWILNYPADILKLYDSSKSIFNENMEFNRQDRTFYAGIDTLKKIYKSSLASYINIWSPEGQQALRDDKIAMLYLGSWGGEELQKWVPGQAGKWRVTRLPFNLYGSNNSVIMSINAQSKNKKFAWTFIEYYIFNYKTSCVNGAIPAYLRLRTKINIESYNNEFLGGQKEQLLYQELINELKDYTITPLDEEANVIWHDHIINGISRGLQPNEIIENAKQEINNTYKEERKILLDTLKNEENE
jgi:multiple sugar transport system substrate-binding protein